jgi:hypothetical protein
VAGVGEVHAVAEQDSGVSVGHVVRLDVDLSRAAVLAERGQHARSRLPG